MRLFLTLGYSYGSGTSGPRPVHKVHYLPGIHLIVHLRRQSPMNRAYQILQRQSQEPQLVQQGSFRFVQRVSDLRCGVHRPTF
jgi:hypothetical protein